MTLNILEDVGERLPSSQAPQGRTSCQWSPQVTQAAYFDGLASKVNNTCTRLMHAVPSELAGTTLKIHGSRRRH